MKRLVVLLHAELPFEGLRYDMETLVRLWRENGHEVTLARGPEKAVDADAALLHVDLTVVPEPYLAFMRRYPVAINGRTGDISKRRLSRQSLKPGEAWDGPVIVKPTLNSRAVAETRLARLKGLPPPPARDFELYETLDQVPPEAWTDEHVVVERFLPEWDDGLFRLRLWKFFGKAERHILTASPEPIVKGSNVVKRETLDEPVPDDLRRLREELGFDFGKFDYGIVDGRVVLYDTNRTPTFSRPLEEELPRLRDMAAALPALL